MKIYKIKVKRIYNRIKSLITEVIITVQNLKKSSFLFTYLFFVVLRFIYLSQNYILIDLTTDEILRTFHM